MVQSVFYSASSYRLEMGKLILYSIHVCNTELSAESVTVGLSERSPDS